MSTDLVELFEKLSGRIAEVCDVELVEDLTEIYEGLVTYTVKLGGKVASCEKERDEKREKVVILEKAHWDLVRNLARCEKKRDEERTAREQAEYDAEYYAKELTESR